MTSGPGDGAAALAALAGLLADRTRAAICLALLDGRAWTAGELAAHAGVAPSTVSEHLDRLVGGGLLVQERQGRHRYVRLASPRAAQLVEDLVAITGAPLVQTGSLRRTRASAALAGGRTCYDHLAGRIGVALTDAMTTRGLLDAANGLALTPEGLTWLSELVGVEEDELRRTRRPLGRQCLDWTERRPHVAGVVGARVCGHALKRGWVVRAGGGRAVRLTRPGATALRAELGIVLDG